MGNNERMFLMAVLEAAVKWIMTLLQKGETYARDNQRESGRVPSRTV